MNIHDRMEHRTAEMMVTIDALADADRREAEAHRELIRNLNGVIDAMEHWAGTPTVVDGAAKDLEAMR